jgi:hypothetical protein
VTPVSPAPSERPGEHPPPPDLAGRSLPLRTFRGPWFRLHAADRDPVFFGRTGLNRFDAPDGSFGVLYVGADAECAFIETFGWETGTRLVTAAALATRRLAELRPPRPLRLVDLTGAGLARVGADARLFAGAHAVARAWSGAFHAHPQRPDGIYYPARHDPSRRAAALYDRVSVAEAPAPPARTRPARRRGGAAREAPGGFTVRSLGALDARANRELLARILDRYGYAYVA